MKRYIIFLILTLSNTLVQSQINYDEIRRKKLQPIEIDTTSSNCISVDKRYATVYFNKTDLRDYIKPYNTFGVRLDLEHESIEAVLDTSTTRLAFVDWWGSYTEEERRRFRNELSYNNVNEKIVDDLYYPCADLIHDGKFMILDNESKEVVERGLKIKRVKGLYGTRYVEFQLPNGLPFWTIVSRLGE